MRTSRTKIGFGRGKRKPWLLAGMACIVVALILVLASGAVARPKVWPFTSPANGIVRGGVNWHPTPPSVTGGVDVVYYGLSGRRQVGLVYFGVTYLPVTEVVAHYYHLDGAGGALITAVEPNSPADRAGLKPRDVIIEFAESPITLSNTLVAQQLRRRPGERISLTLLRGRERRQVDAILAPMSGN